jgi:putative endonuclease
MSHLRNRTPKFDRQAIGKAAEQRAERWLHSKGLGVVARNYRCRGGEIDLIMRDGDVLVFVEVRYRSRKDYGGPIASVNARKRQRLSIAAARYLQDTAWSGPCRFDVVGIASEEQPPDWIRDAFTV